MGLPVLLNGNGGGTDIDHLGAHGTEGPFLALTAGARVKHPLSELEWSLQIAWIE